MKQEEKKLPEELAVTEAAASYAKRGISSNADPCEETMAYQAVKDAFIAGAEWQKERDVKEALESGGSCSQMCYELGRKDMRKEMMEGAVEKEMPTTMPFVQTSSKINQLFGTACECFMIGAEWQRNKMLEGAVECMVMDFSSNLPRPQVDIRLDPGKYHTGDKVRIIIVEEDEE